MASSTTVLSNLAYLIGAVVLAILVGLGVWLRHRQPKSVDATISSFRRGLSALAPEEGGPQSRPADTPRIRATPVGLSHVRLEDSPPRVRPDAGSGDQRGGAEAG
ncbi:MAG: hypothetical protein KGQ66_17495 [Acidobacteriota bacterium]|nr:hypothetical protein [Acidobacteriota bacterium]